MDPISFTYTNAPFPSRGADRVCFVIAVEKAAGRTLDFAHNPKLTDGRNGPCTAWHRRSSGRRGAHREVPRGRDG
jgi:hypothetical protein